MLVRVSGSAENYRLCKVQQLIKFLTFRSVHFHPNRCARPSFPIFRGSGSETTDEGRICSHYLTLNWTSVNIMPDTVLQTLETHLFVGSLQTSLLFCNLVGLLCLSLESSVQHKNPRLQNVSLSQWLQPLNLEANQSRANPARASSERVGSGDETRSKLGDGFIWSIQL